MTALLIIGTPQLGLMIHQPDAKSLQKAYGTRQLVREPGKLGPDAFVCLLEEV